MTLKEGKDPWREFNYIEFFDFFRQNFPFSAGKGFSGALYYPVTKGEALFMGQVIDKTVRILKLVASQEH